MVEEAPSAVSGPPLARRSSLSSPLLCPPVERIETPAFPLVELVETTDIGRPRSPRKCLSTCRAETRPGPV